MLPYEILLNFKGTLSTCARGFVNKKKSLKNFNYKFKDVYNYSLFIQKTNPDLLLYYKDANRNNIKRFHSDILLKCQANSKDLVSINSNKTTVFGDNGVSSNMNDVIKSSLVQSEVISTNKQNITIKENLNIPEVVKRWLFSDIEKVPNKDIERLFREPKAFIHNLYSTVVSETKIRNCFSSKCKSVNISTKKSGWSFTYDVQWPEQKSFTTISHSKASASNSAALKCLYWLHINKRIVNRSPVVYNKNEISEFINENYELKIDSKIINKVNVFLENNEKTIYDTILENTNKEVNKFVNDDLTKPRKHPISHITVDVHKRNITLQDRLEKRENIEKSLPIFNFQSEIIKEIEENQALVIKGDTGCGKTTQVPQFIIDYFTAKGKAANCSMIVTQPRRLSAISLAQRIAYERNETVGDVIGYQVRLQQMLPKQHGSILFCTTGVLLKKLQINLALEGCSHVIIDEAHERNIDTDMLLVLLKRAMKKNPLLKVIIMSATINADLFQEYLGCNSVEVPGRLFPVHMHFLEDIQKLGFNVYGSMNEENDCPNVNCDQITDLITWISINKPPGAILCFLPGWNHIQKVQQNLLNDFNTNNVVIPLHSKIPYVDQKVIFDSLPHGKRKIILSTDIAETGITVPDVVYVVDSACRKEVRWHENKGLSSIDTHWISRANIKQRKGRAGRVQKGESYHFLTRLQYEELEEYPIPEVLRVSLEQTVLNAKTFSNEMAEDYLGSMPQPPRLSSVKRAVKDLQILGALDQKENLTALGKRIALFSIHPKLSKAMVYSSIFECLNPISSIAATLSSDLEIFYGTLTNKSNVREMKSRFHPTSDHLAIAWIYIQWLSIYDKNPRAAYQFCKKNNLYLERISTLQKVRDLNIQHLCEASLLDNVRDSIDLDNEKNNYATVDELVRGVLLAGLDQVLKQRNFDIRKGRLTKHGTSLVTEDNTKAQLTPECVNYKRNVWPSPFLTYYQKTHHQESRLTLIREGSIISPLTVLLFSQGKISGSMYTKQDETQDKVLLKIDGKPNVNILCDRITAEVILQFRDLMWSVVRYYVENTKSNWEKNNDVFGEDTMDNYKTEMLKILASLLNAAAKPIDLMNETESSLENDDLSR